MRLDRFIKVSACYITIGPTPPPLQGLEANFSGYDFLLLNLNRIKNNGFRIYVKNCRQFRLLAFVSSFIQI